MTVIEPGEPGGEQATSYGNAGWLSSHSVVPPALPGAWRKVPGWLADPLVPLAVRWTKLSVNKQLKAQLELIEDASIAFEVLTMQSNDHLEAGKAFIEKRKPKFPR